MTKDNNLYFLPLIADAFESADPEDAFKRAIKKIVELGEMPDYKQGYYQFEEFMGSGIDCLVSAPEYSQDLIKTLRQRILEKLASGTFDGPSETKKRILEIINQNEKLKIEYKRLSSILPHIEPEKHHLEIQLFREDKFVSEYQIAKEISKYEFAKIKPGFFSLKLSNGRILWQGELEPQDLFWADAFPDREYSMAADTEGITSVVSLEKELLDSELYLSIYPGLESGRIVIKMNNPEE